MLLFTGNNVLSDVQFLIVSL